MDNNRNNGKATRNTVRGLVLGLVALTFTGLAFAQDGLTARFKGGIGVIPVTGVAADGTVSLNVVRGVNPAGPWRIADLDAVIDSNGHIKVSGRGLLLAAGNGIGTNANASVHATLFCGAANSAVAFDEAGVKLAANGNFVIDDFVSGNEPLSSPCANPVLLIRSGATAGQGVWFAAGIPNLVGASAAK